MSFFSDIPSGVNEEIAGSDGALAQLARAPPLQGGSHRFESDMLHQDLNIQKTA
jgi:hypothetical protein